MKAKLLRKLRTEARYRFYVIEDSEGTYKLLEKDQRWGEPNYSSHYGAFIHHSSLDKDEIIEKCEKLRRKYINKYLLENNLRRIY